MSGRRRIWPAARSRTVVQIVLLALFGWLFVEARLRAGTGLNPAAEAVLLDRSAV